MAERRCFPMRPRYISRDAVHVLIQRLIQMIARLNYAYTINFNGIERDSEHFLRVRGAVKMHRLPSLPLVYRRLSMSFRVVPQPMKFHPSGLSPIVSCFKANVLSLLSGVIL